MTIKTESITLEYGEVVSHDIHTYIENSDGTCLENYYDEKGNILERRTYNKNNSSVGEIIRYEYDEKGLLVTEDDNKKVTYLPNNFVSKIETKSGSVTCYGRDFNTKNVIETGNQIFVIGTLSMFEGKPYLNVIKIEKANESEVLF